MTDFPFAPPLLSLTGEALDVPTASRESTSLVVRDGAIRWGLEAMAIDAIVAVRYGVRLQAGALWQHHTAVRRVIMNSAEHMMEITLRAGALDTARERRQADAYFALTEFLHHQVEPVLRRRLMARMARGERIELGPIAVTPEGLLVSKGRTRALVAWERLPSAHFEHGRVIVTADSARGSEAVAEVSMLAANAVLLPDLCTDAISAFA